MRRVLVLLALFASLPGCRRAGRSLEPTPAAPPDPAAPRAAAAAATLPAPPAGGPTSGTPAVAADAAVTPTAAVAPAPAPPPLPVVDAPAPSGPAASPDADEIDEALYRWTDEQGTVHFSSGTDVPDDRRRSARRVGGGITVVPAPPVVAPTAGAGSSSGGTPSATETSERPAKGPKPELDAQGLPVPGTMEETSHTRAVKQATGVTLDPASVERRYQQQLRDMNCREENGVVTCG